MRGDARHIGKNSLIHPLFHSWDVKSVYIGDNVEIHAGGWIAAITEYAQDKFDLEIKIGDGTYIWHRCHIVACDHMTNR